MRRQNPTQEILFLRLVVIIDRDEGIPDTKECGQHCTYENVPDGFVLQTGGGEGLHRETSIAKDVHVWWRRNIEECATPQPREGSDPGGRRHSVKVWLARTCRVMNEEHCEARGTTLGPIIRADHGCPSNHTSIHSPCHGLNRFSHPRKVSPALLRSPVLLTPPNLLIFNLNRTLRSDWCNHSHGQTCSCSVLWSWTSNTSMVVTVHGPLGMYIARPYQSLQRRRQSWPRCAVTINEFPTRK